MTKNRCSLLKLNGILLTLAVIVSPVAQSAVFEYFQPLPQDPLVPDNNPLNSDKIELGKKLFFDKNLSGKGEISCNSCHDVYEGGDSGSAKAVGNSGNETKRSPPTLLNIGLQTVYYWDGRETSLESLVLEHLRDPDIMGAKNLKKYLRKLAKDTTYLAKFTQAFNDQHSVNPKNVSRALASFMRSLLTPNSRFDRYMKGDKKALTKTEKAGMEVFKEVGCLACHFGVNFAGPAPGPALGLGEGFYELFPNYRGTLYERSYDLLKDPGRVLHTNDVSDINMWRVPTLRNIALTAPYFHNGSAGTLEEAVNVMAKTQLDKVLSDDQVDQLIAFLKSLTGELPAILKNDKRTAKR